MQNWTIRKYPIAFDGRDHIAAMPMHGDILRCDLQNGQFMIWARVKADDPVVPRRFDVIGTGDEAPGPFASRHLGTIFDGPFVWHAFEILTDNRWRGREED